MGYRGHCVEPEEQRAHEKGMKVHLREVSVGDYTYRVVTLRPSASVRFSTNFFHGTWHVLTDREGAFVLSRLLWGLAFQRKKGTAVLIGSAHLVPTPFDADPPAPILLVPTGLTRVDGPMFRFLSDRMAETPALGWTARWQTFGLPTALAAEENINHRASRVRAERVRIEELASRERVTRIGGLICCSAPQEVLREQALRIYRMRACGKTDYHFLADSSPRASRHPDGEVQVFRDFRDMVSAARVARRRVIGQAARIGDESERERVYRQAEILARAQYRARLRRFSEDRE